MSLFSGTTGVSQFQKKSSGLYGAGEDNRDRSRHTSNLAGRHSMRTNQRPTSNIPPIFTPDALPAATLPIYPGLGQAPNMLACIPNGLVVQYVRNQPCNLENTVVSTWLDDLYCVNVICLVLGDSNVLHALCFTYCRNTVSMLLTVQTCQSHWSPLLPTYLQLPSIAVSLRHHTRTPMSLHVQWKMSFSCCSCYLPLPLTPSLPVRHYYFTFATFCCNTYYNCQFLCNWFVFLAFLSFLFIFYCITLHIYFYCNSVNGYSITTRK